MDLLPCPHKTVLNVLKDIYLFDSLRGTLFPASPIPVIVKIVLSGAGLKDLIPGFRPGKFVADLVHRQGPFCGKGISFSAPPTCMPHAFGQSWARDFYPTLTLLSVFLDLPSDSIFGRVGKKTYWWLGVQNIASNHYSLFHQ